MTRSLPNFRRRFISEAPDPHHHSTAVLLSRRLVMRQRKPPPRKLEVIVRSVFADDVVLEERILVEGTVEEPVELTFDLDDRNQAREFL